MNSLIITSELKIWIFFFNCRRRNRYGKSNWFVISYRQRTVTKSILLHVTWSIRQNKVQNKVQNGSTLWFGITKRYERVQRKIPSFFVSFCSPSIYLLLLFIITIYSAQWINSLVTYYFVIAIQLCSVISSFVTCILMFVMLNVQRNDFFSLFMQKNRYQDLSLPSPNDKHTQFIFSSSRIELVIVYEFWFCWQNFVILDIVIIHSIFRIIMTSKQYNN